MEFVEPRWKVRRSSRSHQQIQWENLCLLIPDWVLYCNFCLLAFKVLSNYVEWSGQTCLGNFNAERSLHGPIGPPIS